MCGFSHPPACNRRDCFCFWQQQKIPALCKKPNHPTTAILMPAKKGSTARKPSIKAKSGAKSKAQPKKNASSSKKAPTTVPAKKKDPKVRALETSFSIFIDHKLKSQLQKSKIPEYLEVPTLEDDELVVSDEDMQFFEEHGDFTGFLKSMDKKAISK
jgi:hypothetical protein